LRAETKAPKFAWALGGRGAVLSDAEPALVALADRVGALLATSVCGHGLFSKNPWSVGISGGFSSPVADDLIAESDFILGFGASFTQWTTKKGKLIAPGAVVAQVDIEAPKLGYQMPIQHAVHATRGQRRRRCWRNSTGAA
jgi:thiamine pyrophosphate-dependent acetolactate synthase large subunit-like protein